MTDDLDELRAQLWGSYLLFTRTFFPIVTGRDFVISNPPGRESHFITIGRELTRTARMDPENTNLIINVPPGHGKSVMLSMWVAWLLSKYPNSQFLYISYGKVLATKHTEFIKRIISTPHYRDLFGVTIRHDSKAKDFFQTTQGGTVKSFGSSGAITGQDGGLPNCPHFSGAVIMDDMHKPDEVHSDTIRQTVIDNYRETILQRPRAPNVPMVFIGQRLHEDDLPAYMLSGEDERKWKAVVLKSIDDAGNALYPDVNPLAQLREKQAKNPYVFASQFQQDPIPAGGALFKPENFVLLGTEPKMLRTFITADTAETAKSYNDATVFSFWGMYEIEEFGQKTGQIGLHCLDVAELRIEPKDLKDEFISFYSECMLHPVKPLVAAIEKKSTGVTLVSTLQDMRGLQIREVKRTRASGSKTERFLEMQPIIAAKLISFTDGARHVEKCVTHMMKITANDTHRHDDICFIRDTKIATTTGYVNIQDIKIGNKVITPLGVGTVTACGSTGYAPVVKNVGLEGTNDHPIFNGTYFERLDTVCDDSKLDKLSLIGLLKWKFKKLLYSMAFNIDSWDRSDIILVNRPLTINDAVQKACTLPFGSISVVRAFPLALLFTIKIIIILITTSATWSVFLACNTLKTTKKIGCVGTIAKKAKSILNWFRKRPNNGIEAIKAESGTVLMHEQAFYNNGILSARFVTINSKDVQQEGDIVRRYVSMKNMQSEPVKKEQEKEVFSLTVEPYGVYYANGILVSNCDTFYDAIKIALIDKSLSFDTKQDASIAATIMQGNKMQMKARSLYYGGQQTS